MDELFFGIPRVGTTIMGPHGRMHKVKKTVEGRRYIDYTSRTGKKVRKYLDESPRRRRRASPKRRRTTPKRRRTTPKRRRSPTRKCGKLSLAKLRNLAEENGIDIYSNAKRKINKKTGEPVKAKKVSCSTLQKRLREAGLQNLYRIKSVDIDMDSDDEEMPMEDMPMMDMDDTVDPEVFEQMNMLHGPCGLDEYFINGKCTPIKSISQTQCVGPDLMWNRLNKPPSCERRPRAPDTPLQQPDIPYVELGPCGLDEYFLNGKCTPIKSISQTQCVGPDLMWNNLNKPPNCEKRPRAPDAPLAPPGIPMSTHINNIKDFGSDQLENLKKLFGMQSETAFGQRTKHKAVARIRVNNREKLLYRGSKGGLFYMKGKNKVYINADVAKKRRSPLRRRN